MQNMYLQKRFYLTFLNNDAWYFGILVFLKL